MKKKFVKIGIVGCGRVFEHYIKIFKKRKLKDYEILVVCDSDKNKADRAAKIFKCQKIYNYFSMLKKFENKLDLIIILTPSGSHYEQSMMALSKNFNVLCEKPATMLSKDALKIDKLSKKKKKMFGIAFQNRFNKSVVTLKKLYDKKKFGKILIVNVRLLWSRYQNYYNDKWHGKWKYDGGVTNQQAIHHIDVARWIFGPISEVNSMMTNQINKLQAEDTNNSIIKFKNGATGSIQVTTAVRPSDLSASLEVIGEKGFMVLGGIALNKIENFYFTKISKKEKKMIKESNEKVENGYGNSHSKILNIAFKNIMNKKTTFPVSALEGYSTANLIHALYKSDEKKKWVKVKHNVKSNRLGR
jgi:UDP-N-acetyl-2-amino-2-deoxyglucuronate dehydrogenase